MIARWLSLLVAQVIFKVVVRAAVAVLVTAVAVAVAPVSLVAAGAVATAWARGWQPRQLLTASAWCAPMVMVWLAFIAGTAGWHAVATAPLHAWLEFWHPAPAGAIPAAAATVAPAAIPFGLLVASAAWAYRIRSLRAGAGGLSPAAAVAFDQRQGRHPAGPAR